MNRVLLPVDHTRVEVYADRTAWLAARGGTDRNRIGASEVASILGVEGAYRTPWEVWGEKTGALPRPEPTAAERRVLERGQRWEHMVLSEYAEQTERVTLSPGDAVGQPGALVIVRHAVESWAVCSPDGVVIDPEYGTGLVEGKTAQIASAWGEVDVTLASADDYTPDLAPAPYVCQSFWQLATTNVPFVDLACLLPRYSMRIVRILPDLAYQDQIVNQVGEWRERHLIRGEEPPVDGSEACGRYLTKRFPGKGKDVRDATAEEAELLRTLANVKAARKECESTEETLCNQLHALMGDTYGVRLASGAKALLIPMKGRQTAKLAEIEKQRPELFAELVAGGFVGRGEDYRSLRLSGF